MNFVVAFSTQDADIFPRIVCAVFVNMVDFNAALKSAILAPMRQFKDFICNNSGSNSLITVQCFLFHDYMIECNRIKNYP